jgi:AGCS family alanine or glycine:cation symporter
MAEFLSDFSGWLWGNLLYLLLGGGAFFAFFSLFAPFRHLGHGLRLLLGKEKEEDAPGEVSHFRALCSALSGTVGMGNVSGVAIAITEGGPGALFWIWVCALLGRATKF